MGENPGQPPETAFVSAKDRRAVPRFPILMKGTMEPIGVPGAPSVDVVTTNISVAGVLVHTNRAETLSVDDLVALTFTPLLEGNLIRLRARVVWMRKDMLPQLGSSTVGLLFYGTPEEDIRRLLDVARAADALKLISEPY